MRQKLLGTICLLAAALLVGCGGGQEETSPVTTQAGEVTTDEGHVHEYTETVKAATCTEGGSSTFTCACGDSYTGSETAALGHSYVSTVVAPTWEEQGYTEHTCSACGDTWQDSFVECEKYSTQPPSKSGEVLHFFDDAAFIGDSVSLKLKNYQAEYGTFGSATFLTAGSYSVRHAVNGTMFLVYQGQQMAPEDALAACGAKKVFILLGMNDVGSAGIEETMENWAILVARIREKCPDIEIYIQSGTPIYIGGEKVKLNNKNMDLYNEQLKIFAEENGCHFVDIATVMKDENGGLKAEFCSDSYVHLTYEACDAWALVLKEYVGEGK